MDMQEKKMCEEPQQSSEEYVDILYEGSSKPRDNNEDIPLGDRKTEVFPVNGNLAVLFSDLLEGIKLKITVVGSAPKVASTQDVGSNKDDNCNMHKVPSVPQNTVVESAPEVASTQDVGSDKDGNCNMHKVPSVPQNTVVGSAPEVASTQDVGSNKDGNCNMHKVPSVPQERFLKFNAGNLFLLPLFGVGMIRIFSRPCIIYAGLLIMFLPVTGTDELQNHQRYCSQGQYLSQTGICLPCPEGTYMDQDKHHYFKCKNCSEPDFKWHETILTNCTSKTNTELGCLPGFKDHGHIKTDVHSHKPDCRETAENQTVGRQSNASSQVPGYENVTPGFNVTTIPSITSSTMALATNVTTTAEDGSGLKPLVIIIIILVIVIFILITCLFVFCCRKYRLVEKITERIKAQGNLESNNHNQHEQFLPE